MTVATWAAVVFVATRPSGGAIGAVLLGMVSGGRAAASAVGPWDG